MESSKAALRDLCCSIQVEKTTSISTLNTLALPSREYTEKKVEILISIRPYYDNTINMYHRTKLIDGTWGVPLLEINREDPSM